jgi:hypothetical protein
MNAILRPLLAGTCLCLFTTRFVAADPPELASGKVLLFEHGGIIEGDITREGDKFRVRHTSGSSVVQAKGIVGLFADKDAVLQYLKQKANLNDPKERVRLARWCQAQGMRQAAVGEAEAALALRPDEPVLKQFVEGVKIFAAATPAPAAPGEPIQRTTAVAEMSDVAVNPESIGLFTTKIQPILVNACAKCHGAEHESKFKLSRTVVPGNQRALQMNLAAASAFLNREQPAASPLLAKAVSIHGGSGAPPLKDRQTPAYRHLEDWVQKATGISIAPGVAPATLPAGVIADSQPLPAMAPPQRPKDSAADPPPPVVTASGSMEPPPPLKPAKPVEAAPPKFPDPLRPNTNDPFDPAIFNQGGTPKGK